MTLEQTKKFTEQDENTLQYYNQNATKFIENTKSVEFHSVQDKFLSYLSDGSYILDFGCGLVLYSLSKIRSNLGL